MIRRIVPGASFCLVTESSSRNECMPPIQRPGLIIWWCAPSVVSQGQTGGRRRSFRWYGREHAHGAGRRHQHVLRGARRRRAAVGYDAAGRLGRLRAPTLILHGRRARASAAAPSAAAAAVRKAASVPACWTTAPPSALPTAVPAANALVSQVNASVTEPAGASRSTSTYRQAIAGAMPIPAAATPGATHPPPGT